MDIINSLLSIISKAAIGGGVFMAAYFGVGLGRSLKDHNGPDITNNIWGIVGGIIVCLSGALITQVSFT